MNWPAVPVMLVAGILIIYLIWKVMSPARKKKEPRRFSIRKHKKNNPDDDDVN